LAAGNSNGDLPMLAFAAQPGRTGLRLLVLHDDPSASSTTLPAPNRLQQARNNGWMVVSINHDWRVVFAETPP
jgi:hypothetical protein